MRTAIFLQLTKSRKINCFYLQTHENHQIFTTTQHRPVQLPLAVLQLVVHLPAVAGRPDVGHQQHAVVPQLLQPHAALLDLLHRLPPRLLPVGVHAVRLVISQPVCVSKKNCDLKSWSELLRKLEKQFSTSPQVWDKWSQVKIVETKWQTWAKSWQQSFNLNHKKNPEQQKHS